MAWALAATQPNKNSAVLLFLEVVAGVRRRAALKGASACWWITVQTTSSTCVCRSTRKRERVEGKRERMALGCVGLQLGVVSAQ